MRFEKFKLPGPHIFGTTATTYVVTRVQSFRKQRDVLAMLLKFKPTPTMVIVYIDQERVACALRMIVAHHSSSLTSADSYPSTIFVLEDTTRLADQILALNQQSARKMEECVSASAEAEAVLLAVAPLWSMWTRKYLRVMRGTAAQGYILSRTACDIIKYELSGAETDVGSFLCRNMRCVSPHTPLASASGGGCDDEGRWGVCRWLGSEAAYAALHAAGAWGGILPVATLFAVCAAAIYSTYTSQFRRCFW